MLRTCPIAAMAAVALAAAGVLAADGGDKMEGRPGVRGSQAASTSADGGRELRQLGLEPGGGRMAPLSEEQQQELLSALQKRRPELYKRVQELRDRPRLYQATLRTAWWWYEKWKNLPEAAQDSFLAEQEQKARLWQLRIQYRQAASPEGKEKVLTEMRQAMGRLLDAEQKIQEHRLSQLEEQISRLREELRNRAAQREQIIDERIGRWVRTEPASRPAR